jgi:hypothetical protein
MVDYIDAETAQRMGLPGSEMAKPVIVDKGTIDPLLDALPNEFRLRLPCYTDRRKWYAVADMLRGLANDIEKDAKDMQTGDRFLRAIHWQCFTFNHRLKQLKEAGARTLADVKHASRFK